MSVNSAASSGPLCLMCKESISHRGGSMRSTARLSCGHFFHLDCIGIRFNTKRVMQCPKCGEVEERQWLVDDDDLVNFCLVDNGIYKLRVETRVDEDEGVVGLAYDGILRGPTGRWLEKFSRRFEHYSSPYYVDLCGIREGLEDGWKRRVTQIEVESDSEIAVELIKEGGRFTANKQPEIVNLIMNCRNLIRKPWTCKISYVPRKP